MNNAVTTKNHLWSLLNENTDQEHALTNCEVVFNVLKHTMGLWAELNYAYKACELLDRIIDTCNKQTEVCNHWKRIEKADNLKNRCYALRTEYHACKYEVSIS